MSYAGIYENDEGVRTAAAHIIKSPKLTTAQINFLLIPSEPGQRDLVPLLEGMVKEAGAWHANHVIAEMSPEAIYFVEFRQAGFSVFSKQRLYCFSNPVHLKNELTRHWRTWTSDDIPAVRSLYHMLVPPLIQPIEPLTRLESLGVVYYNDQGDLQGFADMVYGPAGVWVIPFINPQTTEDIPGLLRQLASDLPDLNGRPVYIAARSYQPWIDGALESSPVERGPEQALLVRYIAVRQPVSSNLAFTQLENGNAEPTYPVTPITGNRG